MTNKNILHVVIYAPNLVATINLAHTKGSKMTIEHFSELLLKDEASIIVSKQAELLKNTKRIDELMDKQAELARDLGEKLVESNKEVVEILSQTTEEYQALAEAGVEQAKSQLDEAAEVVKQAQADAAG